MLVGPSKKVAILNGLLNVEIELPRQTVDLFQLNW